MSKKQVKISNATLLNIEKIQVHYKQSSSFIIESGVTILESIMTEIRKGGRVRVEPMNGKKYDIVISDRG